MRLFAALVLIAFVPFASGHEGEHDCDASNRVVGLEHLRLDEATLAPQQEHNVTTTFEQGCPLRADWWVLYWFDASGPIEISIEHEGDTLADRTVDGIEVVHVQLPQAGFPEVKLRNPGTQDVAVRFYFDQTCDCSVKGSPVSGGPFWFNTAAPAGSQVTFDVQVVPIWTELSKEAEPPAGIALHWLQAIPHEEGPAGSGNALVFDTATDSCGDPGGRFIGCGSFDFRSDGGMQYVYAWASHDGDPRWMIQVRPQIVVEEQASALAWPLAALALVAVAWRRR